MHGRADDGVNQKCQAPVIHGLSPLRRLEGWRARFGINFGARTKACPHATRAGLYPVCCPLFCFHAARHPAAAAARSALGNCLRSRAALAVNAPAPPPRFWIVVWARARAHIRLPILKYWLCGARNVTDVWTVVDVRPQPLARIPSVMSPSASALFNIPIVSAVDDTASRRSESRGLCSSGVARRPSPGLSSRLSRRFCSGRCRDSAQPQRATRDEGSVGSGRFGRSLPGVAAGSGGGRPQSNARLTL